MFTILDGRKHFFQWDLNRKIIVADETVTEVHFCNRTDDCALVCKVYLDAQQAVRVADVPNILLQDNWRISVYAYDGEATKHSALFDVKPRSKPDDYVYTETEVKRWEDLAQKIEDATTPEAIKEALGESAITTEDIITEVDLESAYADREVYNANVVNAVMTEVASVVGETYQAVEEAVEKVAEIEEKNKDNLTIFSNALMGYEEGALVVIDDVSPLVPKVKCSTMNFHNEAKIIRCGKNIFNGITKDAEGLNPQVYRKIEMYLPKGTYTFSSSIPLYYQKKSDELQWLQATDRKSCKLIAPRNGTYFINVRDITSSSTPWNYNTTLQIEVGDVPTQIEQYQGEEYGCALEQEIELTTGINTLYTTDAYAFIKVDYNKDINKAFAQLQQVIISLGGNI